MSRGTMKIKCAWCGIDMGAKQPLLSNEVTHGMCQSCEIVENFKLDAEDAKKAIALAGSWK